ncbi:MAG TPA: hypothetical protein VH475_22500 [Tepidisphaeraceae bacterium]|jgi:hypothetical protein
MIDFKMVITSLASFLLLGCTHRLVPQGVPLYSIKVTNGTDQEFEDVDVVFGYPNGYVPNKLPSVGVLAPGSSATDHFLPVPIPERVRVTWKVVGRADAHQAVVAVRDTVGAQYRGVIQFTIRPGDRVELSRYPHPGEERQQR